MAPWWEGRMYQGAHLRVSQSTVDHSSPFQSDVGLLQKFLQRTCKPSLDRTSFYDV